jgi:transcriptional regulator
MYIPKSFAETDLPTLQDFMQAHSFATFVTQHEGHLVASHLPFMLDTARGSYGTLVAHLARANDQWKSMEGQEALVIFQGPHAYITPTWYSTHPSVPTWNYAVVHAYGVPTIINDAQALETMVTALVEQHEAGRDPAWVMDHPPGYMETMLKGIVGFEITLTRLEGKVKLSQNRSEVDQAQVISGLAESPYAEERATGNLMQVRRGAAR